MSMIDCEIPNSKLPFNPAMFPGTTAVFILFPLTLLRLDAATIINYKEFSCDTVTASNLFSANSTYASNLDSLLDSLSDSASSSGFANMISGSTPSTTVYGLGLCRGDISLDVCTECISLALLNLRSYCPGTKAAIVWLDWCMLRYANRNIFSSMEDDPVITLHNVNNVTGDAWQQVLTSTVRNVTGERLPMETA